MSGYVGDLSPAQAEALRKVCGFPHAFWSKPPQEERRKLRREPTTSNPQPLV